MGLEMVDVVIRTEDAFGIVIADEDMFDIATVGQFYEYVLGELAKLGSDGCLSSRVFYRVRRAMCEVFGLDRGDIKPDTRLEPLLPARERRKLWNAFGHKLDLRVPALVRPRWVEIGVQAIWLAAAGAGLASIFGAGRWWTAGALVAAAVCAHIVTTPLAMRIDRRCPTARDLVEWILRNDFARGVKQEKAWNEQDVWNTLRAIAADSLRVSPEQVTKEAKWVDDLGAG